MSPIFKNYSEAASALSNLLKSENLTTPIFTYINPDAQDFCQLIAPDTKPFFDVSFTKPATAVILDDGSTRANEFVEYTDQLRHLYPQNQIVIATPFVPESEEEIFKSNCDRLITLHVEPLFFDIHQFYQQ